MGGTSPLGGIRGWRQFRQRLVERVAPQQVLLFGSRAAGTHLHSSDIDLLIVSDEFDGMPWLDRLHLVLSLWDGDLAVEPLCYTVAEFERRSKQVSIVREAARTGIPIPLA